MLEELSAVESNEVLSVLLHFRDVADYQSFGMEHEVFGSFESMLHYIHGEQMYLSDILLRDGEITCLIRCFYSPYSSSYL